MIKNLKGVFKTGGDKSSGGSDGKMPRAPRIEIKPLAGVCFSVEGQGTTQIDFEVVNLSEKGIGLCNAPILEIPPAGTVLNGTLVLPHASHAASLKLIHVSDTTIGGAFVGDLVELQKEIQRHFKLETSAVNLVEVTAKRLKEEPDGVPRLFRGRNNCELFIIEQGKHIARFQLSFFGNYIDGVKGAEPKCGFLTTEGGVPKVRFVSHLSPDVLKSASVFLDHVPEISKSQREELRAAISRLVPG